MSRQKRLVPGRQFRFRYDSAEPAPDISPFAFRVSRGATTRIIFPKTTTEKMRKQLTPESRASLFQAMRGMEPLRDRFRMLFIQGLISRYQYYKLRFFARAFMLTPRGEQGLFRLPTDSELWARLPYFSTAIARRKGARLPHLDRRLIQRKVKD